MIDLGDARWDVDSVPSRRWVRPWPVLVAAVVTVALVLTLGGSVPAAWRLGPPLWTVPSNPAMAVVEGLLFMWEPDGMLVARDPSTGAPRWHIDATPTLNLGTVAPGVLAVAVGGVPTDLGLVSPPAVRYVETASGRELRTLPGWPLLVPTGDPDVVLTEQPVSCGQSLDASCTDLAAWSLRTGSQRWRLPYDPTADRFYSRADPRGTFVVITHDGELTLRDLATGAVEAGRHITGWQRSTEPHGYPPVEFTGGTIYTADQTEPNGTITVRAFALAPGGTEWTRSLRPYGYQEARAGLFMTSCDRWLCFFDGGGSWLLDPATGEPVRDGPAAEGLGPVGFGLLSQTTAPQTDAAVTTLSDASSGHVVASVHGELAVVSDGPGPHGALIALISHTWREQDVALVYPSGAIARIGVLQDINFCITSADLLICNGAIVDAQGQVQSVTRAWRLSP